LSGKSEAAAAGAGPGSRRRAFQNLPAALAEAVFLPVDQLAVTAVRHDFVPTIPWSFLPYSPDKAKKNRFRFSVFGFPNI
jgi:hypothetical protein